MSQLVLEGVVKRFDRVGVVDLSADAVKFPAGELSAVIGRAGAGKTTLARLICGLDIPDEGDIRLAERALNGLDPGQRRAGLVMQGGMTSPNRSVADNIELGLRYRGLNFRSRRLRINEVLGLVQLEGFARRPARDLTPPQLWRVALARTLVLDPEVLLLDEPFEMTASPGQREELRDFIESLHSGLRLTTLLFTSRAPDALAIAGHVMLMAHGRILQSGLTSEVYNHPASREAAEILGTINLVPGQTDSVDARGHVVLRSQIGRLVGTAPSGRLRAGTPVMALIRPEAIQIAPVGSFSSNRFPVTVARRAFLGSICRLQLQGPSGWQAIALALSQQALPLRLGQSLNVSVAPEAVTVVPNLGAPPE
jgi:ABC-type Fe3+/spermidine/putrescine transport system ATPase subunit